MIAALRTIRNALKVGPKDYFFQLQRIGDTKVGTLKGEDCFGNKYYEDFSDEIYLRNRWVIQKDFNHHMDQVEPGWRAWLLFTVDTPPNELPSSLKANQAVPKPNATQIMSHTQTTKNYVPYSTVRPRLQTWAWEPAVKERA